MSRNSTHINCNQIAGTVNQGIWKNDCDPCVESGYQIPNITQWLRHRFNVTGAGTVYAGPINTGDIANAAVIARWDDVIGTNHALQATGADKPVWNDADTNILFATSDNMDLTAVTYAVADDFVIVAGFVPTVAGTYTNHALWSGTGNDTVTITSATTIQIKLNNVAQTITGPTLAGQTGCEMINVVLRRENGICQLFIAGIPWGPSFVWTGDYRVDTIGYDGTNSLDGKIANFMQFDRALTDKEIWCLDCYLCGDDITGEPVGCRIGHDKIDCHGDTDGSLTATFLGAVAGSTITYLWSTGATTQTITSLPAGLYTCTLTSNNNTAGTGDDVSTTCTANVTEPAHALVCTTTTVQPVYLLGVLQAATISVAVTGGWGTPLANSNIVWTKDGSAYTPAGSDYFNISTSVAGTYAYTVTDVNGCTCTGTVAITIPGDPTLSITCGHTAPLCHDDKAQWGLMLDASTTFSSTATITAVGSVSGALAPAIPALTALPASSTHYGATGNWFLSNAGNQMLTPGEVWTITITDTGSPVRTATCSMTVINPPEITITESITQPTECETGWSNGHISFIATGGTGVFTYEIAKTSAPTSQLASNIWANPGAGNYTLKATDSNGCVETKNVTITCPLNPMITIAHVVTDMDCFGEKPCDGQVVFTPSATTASGYTFQLTVSDGASIIYDSGQLGTFNAYTLTPLCVGNYTYTYTATHTSSGAVTILANNVPFAISEPALLTITGVVTHDACHGAPGTGAIDTTVVGGTAAYTYAWTTNGGVIPSGQADDADLTGLVAGTYNVLVTDANGCTVRFGWDVGEPCELDTTLSADPVGCGDSSTGTELVCNWTLDGLYNGNGGYDLDNALMWNEDRAGMIAANPFVVGAPGALNCWHVYNGDANSSNPNTHPYPIWLGTGTCGYQFIPGQGMLQNITGLTIGDTYTFQINVGTDTTSSGVFKMAVYKPTIPGLTLLGSETSVTSTGVTTITFVATDVEHILNVHFDGVAGSGTSGTWNQVLLTMPGDISGSEMGAGVSMSGDGKTLITGNLDGSTITYKLCTFGGTGASTYPYAGSAWVEADNSFLKNGNAVYARRENIEISHDGNRIIISDQFWDGNRGRACVYDWTVSDATNCEGYWEQVGANFQGAASDHLGTVALSGDKTTIAIGSPGHDTNKGEVKMYTYNGSAWVQKGATLDGQAGGDQFGFSLALSDDGVEVAIGAPEHDWASGNLKGTVRVYAYAGSAYTQKGVDLDGGNGDRFGHSVSLDGTGSIVAGGSTNHDSAKGTVRVYTYAGSAWAQTGADIDGEYAADLSSCQIQLNTAGSSIVIGAMGHDDKGGANNGQARVYNNVSGTWTLSADITPYSGVATGRHFGNDVAMNESGTMFVGGAPGAEHFGFSNAGELQVYEIQTTSNGATGTGCLQFVSLTGQNTSSNTTDIIVRTDCGTPKYTYAWTLPTLSPANTADLGLNSSTSAGPLTDVTAGTYQVVTTDGNGCTDTATIVIAPGVAPTGSITMVQADSCSEIPPCTGVLQFANYLDPDYSGATYAWFTDAAYTTPVTVGVANTFLANELCAGTYYLQVTQDNGCIWEGSGVVTGGDSGMTLSGVVTDADMCGDCCGAIDLTVAQTPSGAPYTYVWSNGETTQDLSCVPPGFYIVTVTDDNGCQETTTFTVGVSNYPIVFTLNASPTLGQIAVSLVSGGTPPYAYQWTNNGVNFAAGTTSSSTIPNLTPTTNGTYCLTITDSLGCSHTECIGVDFAAQEIEEFNCRVSDAECKSQRTKEFVQGTCDGEKAGIFHDISGDGNTLVVSSSNWSSDPSQDFPGTDPCDTDSNQPPTLRTGKVKMYTGDAAGSSWTQKGQTLYGTGTQDNEYFGNDVSISNDGSTVAIAAAKFNAGGVEAVGSVKVYDYNSTANLWVARPILIGDSGISTIGQGENFGWSICLSGDGTRIVVLARNDKHSSQSHPVFALGVARVYDYAAGAWTQKGIDIPAMNANNTNDWNQANDVWLSNDKTTVFIGTTEFSSNSQQAGGVQAFRFSSSAWNQIGSDIHGTPFAGLISGSSSDWFGYTVTSSSNGNIVAISAVYHGANFVQNNGTVVGSLNATGAVQVYEYSSGAWSTKGAKIYGDAPDNRWGEELSMSGDGLTLIVSAAWVGDCAGKAQVYKFIGANYEEICPAYEGNETGCGAFLSTAGGDGLGKSISMNTAGTRVSISENGQSNRGLVKTYDITYTAAGSGNTCVPCYTLGCGTYSTMAGCIAECAPAASFDCRDGRCIDPGDGTGAFATEALCLADGCTTLKVRYTCKKDVGCVGQVGIGTYATQAACNAACSAPSSVTYYCEILCPDASDAEKYTDVVEKYDGKEGEQEERRTKQAVTGGGRCRIRKNVSPETSSTVYYASEKLCLEGCPWCKDASKYDTV